MFDILTDSDENIVDFMSEPDKQRGSGSSQQFGQIGSDNNKGLLNNNNSKIDVPTSGDGAASLVSVSNPNLESDPRPPKPPRLIIDPAERHPDEVDYPTSITKDDSTYSPGTRRKLELSDDLRAKSPTIGRRGLDIPKKFLKNFDSDSSSSEEAEDAEDEFEDEDDDSFSGREQLALHDFHRLSVIEEDLQEDIQSLHKRESLKNRKLKLIIGNKNSSDSQSVQRTNSDSSGTPVTPGKYSSNWSEWTSASSVTSANGIDRQSSWNSPRIPSPNINKNSSNANEDKSNLDEGNENETDFNPAKLTNSPQLVRKKLVRKSGVKDRKVKGLFVSPNQSPVSSPSNSTHNLNQTDSPSDLLLYNPFTFTPVTHNLTTSLPDLVETGYRSDQSDQSSHDGSSTNSDLGTYCKSSLYVFPILYKPVCALVLINR